MWLDIYTQGKLLLNQNLLKKKSDKWTSCDIYFVLILYSVKQMKSSRTPSSLLFFFFLRVSKLLLSQQTRWTNIFHFVHQILFSERCPRHKMLQKGRNHISRDVETWINDEMLTVSPRPKTCQAATSLPNPHYLFMWLRGDKLFPQHRLQGRGGIHDYI